MTALMFRGNEPIARIAANDRGLAYGDGLFETILADQGELVWWDRHWQRLSAGARRLAIALPDEQEVIGGQHASYTAARLTAFREGTVWGKDKNANVIMSQVAKNLTDEEIQGLSSYLQGLHKAAKPVKK